MFDDWVCEWVCECVCGAAEGCAEDWDAVALAAAGDCAGGADYWAVAVERAGRGDLCGADCGAGVDLSFADVAAGSGHGDGGAVHDGVCGRGLDLEEPGHAAEAG